MRVFFDRVAVAVLTFVFGVGAFFSPQAPAWPGAALPVLKSKAVKAEVKTEFSLSTLALENARPLLRNPDRGLRMETYITLGEVPECYPGNLGDPYEKLLGFIEKYREDSPTVAQLYVYLCRYNDRPLDEAAFAQLERMLALCREQGIRVLLRFAYQNESNPDPDGRRVLGHLDQIGDWFAAHGQLLEDTLCAVQAGIVGYWGEGHGNVNIRARDIGRIFNRLCAITPRDIFVQVRTSALMDKVSRRYRAGLGMHDDYIIGEANGAWAFSLGKEKTRYEKNFPRTLNDGEMPWGVATYYDRPEGAPLNSLDAVAVLGQIRQYALATLSLEHNYREAGPERVFSMERWKDVRLTPAQLEALDMPYLPALFGNGSISAYDYIRYHLGYLLSVTAFEIDAARGEACFTIQNNGFAAPLSFNALGLVIDGEEYLVGGYDKAALGSMRAVTYTVRLPREFDAAGAHAFGIRLAHRAGSPVCARFANDTDFFDGVQMLG